VSAKPTFKEKVHHELKSLAFIVGYVWAILLLFALQKNFLEQRNPFSGQLLALFNAVVLGKVILVLEFFRIGEIHHHRPAIFRILYKSFLFGLVLFMVHFLEDVIHGWFRGDSFSQSLAEIDNGKLMEMGTIAIVMVVALVPYFMLREIARVVGVQKLGDILFGPPVSTPPPGE